MGTSSEIPPPLQNWSSHEPRTPEPAKARAAQVGHLLQFRLICWSVVVLGSGVGGIISLTAFMAGENIATQGMAAMTGMSFAVIPYCIAKAITNAINDCATAADQEKRTRT